MGEVIYIDRFGNIITNIEKDFFYQKKREQDFIINSELLFEKRFGRSSPFTGTVVPKI